MALSPSKADTLLSTCTRVSDIASPQAHVSQALILEPEGQNWPSSGPSTVLVMLLGMHTYPWIYLSTFLLLCQSDITIFISLTILFPMVLGIDPKDLCRLSQHDPVIHASECMSVGSCVHNVGISVHVVGTFVYRLVCRM